jgi:hypothetical protein
MPKTKKKLSERVRNAYNTSFRATVDDTSDDVSNARKTLRKLKNELKEKRDDVNEIFSAARVVHHPIEKRAYIVLSNIATDYATVVKELDRIRKRRQTTSTTSTTSTGSSPTFPKPVSLTFPEAARILKKHKVIRKVSDVTKKGDKESGFLLSKL